MGTVTALAWLVGGLAMFLYGMNLMSGSLEKMAGGKLEVLLKKATAKPWSGLILGAIITIAIQSSSATTVMLVGLVNSGIMQFAQTINVIMGANIGTTVTAWITSLSGVSGDNVFLAIIKPEVFSPIIALCGVIMLMTHKKTNRRRAVAQALIGFSVLMIGMIMMKDAVAPLTESESFKELLTAFSNPILGLLVGIVFTGVIQSSAATIAILQALAMTGNITYGIAIPIILGLNIGTCVTCILSAIGTKREAQRVAGVHILIKIVGAVLCLGVYYGLNAIFKFPLTDMAVNVFTVALIHTIFNIANTIVLLPFSKQLIALTRAVVRDKKNDKESAPLLDERLLMSPSVAVAECGNKTVDMCVLARDTIVMSLDNMEQYDAKTADMIVENEEKIDQYEDVLGTFLVKLSARSLSQGDSKTVSKLLHTIGDFERLSDHAVNLLRVSEEIRDKGLSFSESAKGEIRVATDALLEILNLTADAFANNDLAVASQVEPLEQVIDELIDKIKDHHINRLQAGDCTIEMGFVLSDLLTNYERVSDHCSNIAVAIIETHHNSFETHEYLSRERDNDAFREKFENYREKYCFD